MAYENMCINNRMKIKIFMVSDACMRSCAELCRMMEHKVTRDEPGRAAHACGDP